MYFNSIYSIAWSSGTFTTKVLAKFHLGDEPPEHDRNMMGTWWEHDDLPHPETILWNNQQVTPSQAKGPLRQPWGNGRDFLSPMFEACFVGHGQAIFMIGATWLPTGSQNWSKRFMVSQRMTKTCRPLNLIFRPSYPHIQTTLPSTQMYQAPRRRTLTGSDHRHRLGLGCFHMPWGQRRCPFWQVLTVIIPNFCFGYNIDILYRL